MNIKKSLNYYYSIKNLRLTQIVFLFKKRVIKFNPKILIIDGKYENRITKTRFLTLTNSFIVENNKKYFDFINKKREFISWNIDEEPLWRYNLYYFDYLIQKEITKKDGLELIYSFIYDFENGKLTDAIDPYPISLRIVNWIKFIDRFNINDKKINNSILLQLSILFENLEYDLMANHLLTNLLSLKFSLFYFKGKKIEFFKKIIDFLLKKELSEQINSDGLHYERSFMYSNIILTMILDIINLTDDKELIEIAEKMLKTSFQFSINSNIPLFNDAANNITIEINRLIEYARALNLSIDLRKSDLYFLRESNFIKFKNRDITLLFDGGGDLKYQVGHIHSSALSFELYYKNEKIFTDIGTFTYLVSKEREYLRATKNHNTISINNRNQSNLWSAFRMAQRAKYFDIEVKNNRIYSKVKGYSNYLHSRELKFKENSLIIIDKISAKGKNSFELTFNLTPNQKPTIKNNKIILDHFIIYNNYEPKIEKIEYYPEFNKKIDSNAIKYYGNFSNQIEIITKILFQ